MVDQMHGWWQTLGVSFVAVGFISGACSGSAVIDGHGAGASSGEQGCSDRILPVTCRAEPPDCAAGEFPASHGTCWTGECLDCVDGCQSNDDCVIVEACGCYYHEGCSWAETRYRADRLDPCIRAPGETCSADCPSDVCGALDCPWCTADVAQCDNGRCRGVVNHECY